MNDEKLDFGPHFLNVCQSGGYPHVTQADCRLAQVIVEKSAYLVKPPYALTTGDKTLDAAIAQRASEDRYLLLLNLAAHTARVLAAGRNN